MCLCAQTAVLEGEKIFGVHTAGAVLADFLLDAGLPMTTVKDEMVDAFIQLCEGVRVGVVTAIVIGLVVPAIPMFSCLCCCL
jgi:hypothetical protein